jgi:hypothetical protein
VAENKSQHFVPQHYLRGFSVTGRSVSLCHLKSGNIVSNASIRDQCCRDYFYGKDVRIERAFMEIEGGDEAVLKDIRQTLQLPTDAGSRDRLALCAVVFSGRTAKSIDRLRAAVSEISAETTRRFFKLHGLRPPTEAEIEAANPADDLAPKISVETVLDMQSLVSDLRMKLLIATAGNQFITSDHPTVITNQRFHRHTNFPSTSGLAMNGIQLFLPLSPSACLMLYDSNCYRVGARREETVVIDRQGDIDGLNALQILNADSVVYFRCEGYAANVLALRGKFMPRRSSAQEATQKFSTPTGGVLFMQKKDDIRIPAQWSFCKIIKRAPTRFAPRDSEVVRLYRAWGDEQEGGSRIPFSNWLKQRRS